jgi:hypothetical protein
MGRVDAVQDWIPLARAVKRANELASHDEPITRHVLLARLRVIDAGTQTVLRKIGPPSRGWWFVHVSALQTAPSPGPVGHDSGETQARLALLEQQVLALRRALRRMRADIKAYSETGQPRVFACAPKKDEPA